MMNNRLHVKRALAGLTTALFCAAALFSTAATVLPLGWTPKEFAKPFNAKVKLLPVNVYKDLKINSYSIGKDKKSFTYYSTPKRNYLATAHMKCSLTGKLDDGGAINEITMLATPLKQSDAGTVAYAEEWTTTGTLVLTTFFPTLSDSAARNLMSNEIGLPIAVGGKMVSAIGTKSVYSGTIGESKFELSGARKSDGTVSMTAKLLGADGEDAAAGNALIAGKTITVQLGDSFYAEQVYSAGTGYTWEYESTGSGACRLIETKSSTAPRTGGPTTERFSFQATRVGDITLKFALARPWEGINADTQTVVYTVKVVY